MLKDIESDQDPKTKPREIKSEDILKFLFPQWFNLSNPDSFFFRSNIKHEKLSNKMESCFDVIMT